MPYRPNPSMVVQRTYLSKPDGSRYGNIVQFLEAQADNDAFDPERPVIGLSVPDEQKVFSLNAVAGLVFEAAIAGKDADWTVATVCGLFDAPADVVAQDVAETIDDLLARGIIVDA